MSAYDPFAGIYDEWAAVMTEDVAFYVQLAREAEGPIVELGVGTGRVAIPVGRESGRPVLGIDSSPAMLELARRAAADASVEVELREGDMRELTLEEPAALIYCPFRALLHLPTWGDRRRLFERVAASLHPGGRFAWNSFVFNPAIAAGSDGVAKPHAPGSKIWEYVKHAPGDNRVDVTAFVGGPRADPRNVSLWWVTRSEWEGLLDVSGLETEALYGWFDRRPFDDESPEFVWVARKPT
ncbi:MAG TPA: class I SAM-dependent methyltransferase [Gaiellaceae bacterium]|nr:class I SAM-dependent methyltransferase [Gaiellaceae bacterium]